MNREGDKTTKFVNNKTGLLIGGRSILGGYFQKKKIVGGTFLVVGTVESSEAVWE